MEKIIELVKSQELKFEDELKYTVSYKEGYTDALNTVIKAIKNLGDIGDVSKRSIIEIDFAGNLKAQIETTDKQPKILKAMNGYGDAIDVEYVTIETDC